MADESSVKVAVRIRPQIARERLELCHVCTCVTPGEPQVTLGNDRGFTFDQVFDTSASQDSVYETCVRELIEGCFEGYNATVLAYGQTGSGKTYTMGTGFEISADGDCVPPPGIVPRAIRHIFNGISQRQQMSATSNNLPNGSGPGSGEDMMRCSNASNGPNFNELSSAVNCASNFICSSDNKSDRLQTSSDDQNCVSSSGASSLVVPSCSSLLPPSFSVSVQFVELYNEEVIDLLDETRDVDVRSRKSNIRIHEDSCGGIYVAGLSSKVVSTVEETLSVLRNGALTRTTASTNMNSQSSRSHAIFTIHIRQERFVPSVTDGPAVSTVSSPELEILTAKFHFVDLAGSERLKRTGATGDRAKEGISINCGLLALGNVISALGDPLKKSAHVPYRDSKLTRLLQDSLGGNSRTVMIACISPSDCDFVETLNTLKYANRARNIKNKITVNQDKHSHLIAQLRAEVNRLQQELSLIKQGKGSVAVDGIELVNDSSAENTLLRAEMEQLRVRVKALQETLETVRARNIQLLANKELSAISATEAIITENGGTENGDSMAECGIRSLVQRYLGEIEELKTRLVESESTCEILRRQMSRMKGFGNNNTYSSPIPNANLVTHFSNKGRAPNSHRMGKPLSNMASSCIAELSLTNNTTDHHVFDVGDSENCYSILDIAKADINRMKARSEELALKRAHAKSESEISVNGVGADDTLHTETEDGEDSEASDVDEKENDAEEDIIQQDLAELQTEISVKERLVEELEQSQRRLVAMRSHYEEKLKQLQSRIHDTEMERDRVLTALESKGGGHEAAEKTEKVRADYEKRLAEMRGDMRKLQTAQKEHSRLAKEHSHNEAQLQKLQAELMEMKRAKVQLVQRMKEEANRARQAELKRSHELEQIRKDTRKKEHLIQKLQAEGRSKELILRRKQEEVTALRKIQKPFSAKVAGQAMKAQEEVLRKIADRQTKNGFNPKAAKQRWTLIEKCIGSAVTKKQTILTMEQELDRWLKKRDDVRKQLAVLQQKLAPKADGRRCDEVEEQEIGEQIESLSANIEYIQTNIQECQQNIMGVEEANKSDSADKMDLEGVLEKCRSVEEAKYLMEHLVSLCITHGVFASQKDTCLKEAEAKYQQKAQELLVHRQLLDHVLETAPSILSVPPPPELTASTESLCTASPSEGVMTSSLESGSEFWGSREKARRRTATTQELLFPEQQELSGVLHSVAEDPEDSGIPRPVLDTETRTCSPEPDRKSISGIPQFVVNTIPSSSLIQQNGGTGRNFPGDSFLMPPPSSLPPKKGLLHSISTSRVGEFVRQRSFIKRQSSTTSLHSSVSPDTSPTLLRRNRSSYTGLPSCSQSNVNSASSTVPFNRSLSYRSSFTAGTNIGNSNGRFGITPPSSPGRRAEVWGTNDETRGRLSGATVQNVFSRLATSCANGIVPSEASTKGVIKDYLQPQRNMPLRCVRTAEGHSRAVLSICATDQYLYSGSKDRLVKVWSLTAGKEVRTLPQHVNNVNCVRISEAFNLLFTASMGYVYVWDLRTFERIRTFLSSGLTHDGDHSPSTPSRETKCPPNENQINHIELNASGSVLFTATNNLVRIWDLRRLATFGKLYTGHAAQVNCLAVASQPGNSSSMLVATGSKDHCVKVFEVPENGNAANLQAKIPLEPPHYDGISALAAGPNYCLFSGSRDSQIKKWDLLSETNVLTAVNAHKDSLLAMRFLPSPLQHLLVSSCRAGYLKLWNSERLSCLAEIHAHSAAVYDLTTNSTHLFTASGDNSVGIWQPNLDVIHRQSEV